MVLCGTWSETSVAQSQLTQFWQIPRHRTLSYSPWTPFFVSHDYPLTVEPGSTPRPLVQKKLVEIPYLLICSFLPCLSWLLGSRVRKSRRDLWITLYILCVILFNGWISMDVSTNQRSLFCNCGSEYGLWCLLELRITFLVVHCSRECLKKLQILMLLLILQSQCDEIFH